MKKVTDPFKSSFHTYPALTSAAIGLILALGTGATGCDPVTERSAISLKNSAAIQKERERERENKGKDGFIVGADFVIDGAEYDSTIEISLKDLFGDKNAALSHAYFTDPGVEFGFVKIQAEVCGKTSIEKDNSEFATILRIELSDYATCEAGEDKEPSVKYIVEDRDGHTAIGAVVFKEMNRPKDEKANTEPVVLVKNLHIKIASDSLGLSVSYEDLGLTDQNRVYDADGDKLKVASVDRDKFPGDIKLEEGKGIFIAPNGKIEEGNSSSFEIFVTDGMATAQDSISVVVEIVEAKAKQDDGGIKGGDEPKDKDATAGKDEPVGKDAASGKDEPAPKK